MSDEGRSERDSKGGLSSSPESVASTRPSELINALLSLLASPRAVDFYHVYASLVGGLCQARFALVLQVGDGGVSRLLGESPDTKPLEWIQTNLNRDRLNTCLEEGYSYDLVRNPDGMGTFLVAVRLIDLVKSVLVIGLPERERAHLKEAVIRMMLVKDLRGAVSGNAAEGLRLPSKDRVTENQNSSDVSDDKSVLSWLDLAADVMNSQRFSAAALTIVNGVAGRLGLRQAALVWRTVAKPRLVAVSHLERFESNSPLVRGIEQAAREVMATDSMFSIAADNARNGTEFSAAAHRDLMEHMPGVQRLTSLPARNSAGQTQAVLVMAADSVSEIPGISNLALVLELCLSWLLELERRQQHWWRRYSDWAREKLQLLFGPGAYGMKLASVVSMCAIVALYFVELPYRVDASAQITTDNTRVITAQVEGRLKEVYADVGDLVASGQVMALLDVTDLQQQRAEVLSEIERYLAEEDKARASVNLAELQVAKARREQSISRSKRIDYQLKQAETRAPFAGVVVEGERESCRVAL